MKTLKISIIATLASLVGWWLRLPQKVWSEHPYLADFLMALALCVVLQFVWPGPTKSTGSVVQK